MYPPRFPWTTPYSSPSPFRTQAPSPRGLPRPAPDLSSPFARDAAPVLPPRMTQLPMSLDEVPGSLADLPAMTEADARSLPKDVYYDLFGSAHPSLVPVMVEYDRAERNKQLLAKAGQKAQTLGRNLNDVAAEAFGYVSDAVGTSAEMQVQGAQAAYRAVRPLAEASLEIGKDVGEAVYEFAGDVASMAEDFALYFQAAPYEEKQEFLLLLGEFVASLNPAASLAIEIGHFIADPAYRTVTNVVLLATSLIPAFRAIRKVPALARLTKRFIERGRRARRYLEADLEAQQRARTAMKGERTASNSGDIPQPTRDHSGATLLLGKQKAWDLLGSPKTWEIFFQGFASALEEWEAQSYALRSEGVDPSMENHDAFDIFVAFAAGGASAAIPNNPAYTLIQSAITTFAKESIDGKIKGGDLIWTFNELGPAAYQALTNAIFTFWIESFAKGKNVDDIATDWFVGVTNVALPKLQSGAVNDFINQAVISILDAVAREWDSLVTDNNSG